MNNRKREMKAEAFSLNGICKLNNSPGTIQTPDEIFSPIVEIQPSIKDLKIGEERFYFFALALEKEIAVGSNQNVVVDCFSYRPRIFALEKFSKGLDIFNNVVRDWIKNSRFFVNKNQKFYLSKILNAFNRYSVKKQIFKLKEAAQTIKFECSPRIMRIFIISSTYFKRWHTGFHFNTIHFKDGRIVHLNEGRKSTEPVLNSNVFNFSPMRKIKKWLQSKMIFLMVNFCKKRKIVFKNKLKTLNFYSIIYYNENRLLN
jgi:hypothetical protein